MNNKEFVITCQVCNKKIRGCDSYCDNKECRVKFILFWTELQNYADTSSCDDLFHKYNIKYNELIDKYEMKGLKKRVIE